jgi:nucleoside-diphosphate-sugar epimerase
VKCLVTGATGFIGRQLCQLLLDRGESLAGLSRAGATLPDGTATQGTDLTRETVAPDLLAGVDTVFHLAGIAHRRAPAAAYEQLNHRATLQLARQSAAAGVNCFLFLSSVKAMGPSPGERVRDEHDVAPPIDDYGRSKWRAECDLRSEFADSAMSVVILRPALVYGPGASGNLQLLARWVGRGLPRPPTGGARSMVACRDLAELMYAVALNPPAGVRTWIVTDGQRYTTRDVYDLLRRAGGQSSGSAWLPLWGWRVAAAMLDLAGGGPSQATFDRLFASELYSNDALLDATQWRPRQRFDEAMATRLLAAGGTDR